jgi:ATP-dependent DNA helicase RecG
VANEQEERILSKRRVSGALTFDALPCLDASLEDLSEERFALVYRRKAVAEDVVQENNRPLTHQLASLRLFDLRHNSPTHAGLLLLADDPTHWLPGAYAQFVRFGGVRPVDPVVNEKRLGGDLLTLLRQLDMLLDLSIRQHPVLVTGLREEMRYDYPRLALRELTLNAFMHRDYQSTAPVRFFWFDDRIEIYNPGGLYGAASADNFPYRTDYRNPLVAEAMRTLGYVNRFGIGVQRAQESLKINGNLPAEFHFDPYSVSVTVRAVDTSR